MARKPRNRQEAILFKKQAKAKEAAAKKVVEEAKKLADKKQAQELAKKKEAFAKETAERKKTISEVKQGNKQASGSKILQSKQQSSQADQARRTAAANARARQDAARDAARENAKKAAEARAKQQVAEKVAAAKKETQRISDVQAAQADRDKALSDKVATGVNVGPTADRVDTTKDITQTSDILSAVQTAPENTKENIVAADTTTADREKALKDFTRANQEWQKAVKNGSDPDTIAALKKTSDDFKAVQKKSVENEAAVLNYVKDIQELDDTAALEKNQLDAITSGKDEKILQAEQELLRKKEKDEAVKGQIAAEEAAQRTLFREQQLAELSGQELDRSANALARQKDAITRTLDSETRSFNEQQRQLAAEGVQLERAEGTVKRRGQIAARSSDAAAAEIANRAAQSGFGGSSAALGAQASARSSAATQAGDILTKLTDVEAAKVTLGEQGTLLGKSFQDFQSGISDSFENLGDQQSNLQANKFKLDTRMADIGIEQENLRKTLSSNLDFLQDTFNLGGSISGANASINAANSAQAKEDQQKAAALSLGVSGIGLAATGNPVLGGVMIVKALADYFDF